MPLVQEEVFLKRVLCSSWHSMKQFSQPFEGGWKISLSLQSPCWTRSLCLLVCCLSLHNIRDGIPHTLRHTFSKWYLKNGGDLFKLSRELGHSSVYITASTYLGDFNSTDAREDHNDFSPIKKLNLSKDRAKLKRSNTRKKK